MNEEEELIIQSTKPIDENIKLCRITTYGGTGVVWEFIDNDFVRNVVVESNQTGRYICMYDYTGVAKFPRVCNLLPGEANVMSRWSSKDEALDYLADMQRHIWGPGEYVAAVYRQDGSNDMNITFTRVYEIVSSSDFDEELHDSSFKCDED